MGAERGARRAHRPRFGVAGGRLGDPLKIPSIRGNLAVVAVAVLVTAILAAGFGLTAGGLLSGPGGLGPSRSEPGATGTDPVGEASDAPGPSPGAGAEGADAQPVPTFDRSRWSFISPFDEPSDAPPRPTAAPVLLDMVAGKDVRPPVGLPGRIELYPGTVSVTPGQPLELHVSTPGSSYRFSVERLDAMLPSGNQVVTSVSGRPGHDYRSLATFDNVTRTARANWPVTDRLDTTSWLPGVYVVYADDAAGTQGRAIFVVRTPVLSADAPAFVFTALTYQAYNLWGGANLYSYAAPQAFRVSFERPYDQAGGRGFWTRYDDRILAWLQRQRLPLQYTTDYDLASNPPEVAPGLLVFPQHAEYVPRPLRDWVNRHVNQYGDMRFMSFGANGFYWQVRLAIPRTAGAPSDIVCYKDPNADPAVQTASDLVTTRWRDEPLSQPEGRLLGAQYVGIVGDSYTRYDFKVTAAMPADLLAGTGWTTGTVVKGLLLGESDAVDAASGGVAILEGRAPDPKGSPMTPTVTIRTSPARARIFMAGTFAWVDGLSPVRVSLGVSAASFERFNRNVLGWLGFPPGS